MRRDSVTVPLTRWQGNTTPPTPKQGAPYPWECPRCRTINAGWVARCRCTPNGGR